jgi:hypothetical protein
MKNNKFHTILKSAGKGLVQCCLAYGAMITFGHFSLLFFGEPEFPEMP